ncbi:hypothetical protein HX127_13830 [Acinetobacter sp. 256-1]|uniref:hypothetical protein n=1 Tax=Acinetobacter sp. 256-1 TaxID=2746721 RepID=UPI002578A546|nr:hypothetical protein [Acinetobacter sp. 256-1]MDM1758615.1 hypothetical protein [Acinetobacter sp. 256-1]
MQKILIFSSAIFAFSVLQNVHAEPSSFQQELQQGCLTIKTEATLGKKLYDQKNYKKALEHFQTQAAWTSFCLSNADETSVKFSENNVITAQNNVALTYAKLGKPMWARAWLMINKNEKSNQFNLKNLVKPKISHDLSGEYVSYAGFGEWDHISVKRTKNAYEISYAGLYMGLRSLIYGPNMGEFDTTFALNQKRAMYKYEDCTIQLDFKADQNLGNYIEVKQDNGDSGCGFGHNVYAGGTFYKVET